MFPPSISRAGYILNSYGWSGYQIDRISGLGSSTDIRENTRYLITFIFMLLIFSLNILLNGSIRKNILERKLVQNLHKNSMEIV